MKEKHQDKNEIVDKYLPEVKVIANRLLKSRLESSVDVDDLVSIGIEEIIHLLDYHENDSFVGDTNKRAYNGWFFGYAKSRASRAMLDYIKTTT